jgi:hypothetical protein
MQIKVLWQYGSINPENAKNFEIIKDWWCGLNGQEILWIQRLLPEYGDMSEIHWQPQRFDESFVIVKPEIRGTTLYWYKPNSPVEHNSTVAKLELDTLQQQLYIYPQAETDIVIRVTPPEPKYQTLELSDVELAIEDKKILLLRDGKQHLEIRAFLTQSSIEKILSELL